MILRLAKKHILVLLAFACIAICMTWPAVISSGTHVVGSGGDAWQTMWRFEDKERSFSSAWQAHDTGSYLAAEFLGYSEPHLVNVSVWPWMWLHLIFNQPVAYNLIWLLSFILSGYAMYLLVRSVGTTTDSNTTELMQQAPAFIAGLFYMFLPFHVAHAGGHFGAMQIQWLPLIFVAAIWSIRKPSVFLALLLSLLVVIQGYTEHHYFLWLTIITLVSVPWWWKNIMEAWKKSASTIRMSYVLFLLGSLLFVAATYLPTARLAIAPDSYVNLGREQLIRFSGDFFAYVTPPAFHPIWGNFFFGLFGESFTGNISESTLYLGIIPLLLVLFFHHSIPTPQKKYWLTLAFVFFVISLGPQLHVFGNVTNIHLPYELFDSIPGISSVRAVARAAVVVGLSTAVLFGLVLKAQLHRWGSAAVLALVVLLEFLFFPVTVQSTQLSEAYTAIGQSPGSRIIEIPAATNYTAASKALYASHVHGKEVLGSIALERAQSQDAFDLPKSIPGIRQLMYLRTTDIRERRVDFFNQSLTENLPDALAWLDVGSILLHTDSLSAIQLAALDSYITDSLGVSGQRFDDVVLYSVYDASKQRAGDGVFLMRDGAWQGVGYDPERNSIFAEIIDTASVTVVNTRSEEAIVRLSFATASESLGSGRIMYNNAEVATINPETSSYTVELRLSEGQHDIQFIADSQDKIIIQNPNLEVSKASL